MTIKREDEVEYKTESGLTGRGIVLDVDEKENLVTIETHAPSKNLILYVDRPIEEVKLISGEKKN